MKTWATAFLTGGLFGFGLAWSGMTNPARVLAFLDVTGAFDPTLALVMIGALAVAALFGLGWGLAGLCPGPAIAGLVTGSPAIALFCVAMLVGQWLAGRLFPSR